MSLISCVQNYLNKMINDVSGMKVLLLDSDTTPIISMVVSQSQLLSKEIYLIDKLDNTREEMKHLKCICFLRPTPLSINRLIEELREKPSYGDYYIYFSNTIRKSDIERLAEADEFEVVREVQEYYADYLAVNPDTFSLNIPNFLLHGNATTWEPTALSRSVEGIISVLLSLKKKPLLRYEKNSILGKKLASEVQYQIQQEGPLFDFRRADASPVLLILDRKNDPVTPLLNQWTYQALVHELIGIQNARVDLSGMPDVKPEMNEVVLSYEQDLFYQKNLYLNLGDLGANIKSYVDEYQVKHHSTKNIESIADMKKFVEDYPEFRKLSGNVSKHVTLVGELSRLVAKECLLEVSELEQNLACIENHSQDSKQVQALMERSDISIDNKIRILLLYALRYEKMGGNLISNFVDFLKSQGVSPDVTNIVYSLLHYAGADQRQEDILLNSDILAKTKNVFKGLKGVENVYTQHTPHIVQTIQDYLKGKLKEHLFPFLDIGSKDKPQELILFMVGGITFAEAREIAKLNAMNTGTRIYLGGTIIHNSKSFENGIATLSKSTTSGKSHDTLSVEKTVSFR